MLSCSTSTAGCLLTHHHTRARGAPTSLAGRAVSRNTVFIVPPPAPQVALAATAAISIGHARQHPTRLLYQSGSNRGREYGACQQSLTMGHRAPGPAHLEAGLLPLHR